MNTLPIDISKGLMSDFPRYAIPQGGLSVCKNLYPWEDVYAAVQDKNVYSGNAVSGTPLSGIEVRDNSSVWRQFVGTTTKLYRLETGRTFTDVTRVLNGNYSTDENQWKFAKYGEWVIATNYNDTVQIMKGMDSSNFTHLGNNTHRCKYLLVCQGHLLLFATHDGTTFYPNRVIHSPKDDIENLTPGVEGYSRRDLPDALGEITGVAFFGDVSDDGTNRTKFAIFHKDSITPAWYVGSPYYFNFEPNRIKNIGAIPNTMVTVGNVVYFWDEKDMYVFDGVYPQPIGLGVKRTILDSINKQYYHRITTAVDLQRNIVFWSYPTSDSTSGKPDRIVAYNFVAKRFTIIDAIDHECIMSFHKAALLMDDMDALFPDLDNVPYDLDSNYWLEDAGILGVMDSNGKMNTLTGQSIEGTLETGEFSDKENKILMTSAIRPKVSMYTGNISVRIGSRFNENEDVDYSSTVAVNIYGYANIEKAGRYLSCEIKTNNHRGISGVDVIGRAISRF